ncbi:hypothetical protein ACOSQ3_031809 [Xanthoceras sorbifolium]
MLGMCLGGARRVEITLGTAWRLPGLCPELSSPFHAAAAFSFYSRALGRDFSLAATTTATCGRGGLVAAFTGRWERLGREQPREEAQVALPPRHTRCCHRLCTASFPREHGSRSVPRVAHWTRSLLRRELHRELGLVAVVLAVLTGCAWARLQRERGREERAGGAGRAAWFCFVLILWPKRRRFGPKLWSKTASFNLSQIPLCQNAPFHLSMVELSEFTILPQNFHMLSSMPFHNVTEITHFPQKYIKSSFRSLNLHTQGKHVKSTKNT